MDSISDAGTACAGPTGGWAISRRLGAVVGATVALATLSGEAPVGRLDVEVSKVRSDKGELRLCLTADPDNFPNCVDDAQAITRSVPASARTIRFDGLPPGGYAVAVIHDENGNKKLDTLLGIPREGFGFSRNPAIGFGPPRFAAARFTLDGHDDDQAIRMRYLL